MKEVEEAGYCVIDQGNWSLSGNDNYIFLRKELKKLGIWDYKSCSLILTLLLNVNFIVR